MEKRKKRSGRERERQIKTGRFFCLETHNDQHEKSNQSKQYTGIYKYYIDCLCNANSYKYITRYLNWKTKRKVKIVIKPNKRLILIKNSQDRKLQKCFSHIIISNLLRECQSILKYITRIFHIMTYIHLIT